MNKDSWTVLGYKRTSGVISHALAMAQQLAAKGAAVVLGMTKYLWKTELEALPAITWKPVLLTGYNLDACRSQLE
jgi:hypothetical protein